TGSAAIFYANVSTSITPTVTVQWGSSATYPEMELYEFSNIASSSSIDASLSASGNSANVTSGSVSTTDSGDLLFGACCVANAVTAGETGWINTVTKNHNGVEFRLPGAIGSYNATWTESASGAYAAVQAAFLPVATTPSPVTTPTPTPTPAPTPT